LEINVTRVVRFWFRVGALLVLAFGLSGCGVKTLAINTIGNALASGGSSTFASDDDPELVRDAVPFALKMMESLLAASPRHKGLLLATSSGFTQYSYAFLQQEADFVEAQDLDRATALRARAKKLYLRALDYGMRGFEVEFPGFRAKLRQNPDAAMAKLTKNHVPLLYYTAAAWGAAFAVDVTDSQLSVDQTIIEKMMRKALVLDERFQEGAIHDFFISWEAGHASAGGSIEKAREHFARARQLAAGHRVSPLVTFAETVSVSEHNRKEFEQLLKEALVFDVSGAPDQKLANVISQRRAQWLLSRTTDLFE
jgi:predicted anti-sigma-YlaC factor YlaD